MEGWYCVESEVLPLACVTVCLQGNTSKGLVITYRYYWEEKKVAKCRRDTSYREKWKVGRWRMNKHWVQRYGWSSSPFII